MAISYVGIGASAEGTTSITPAYPASPAAGDLLILFVVAKHGANVPTTPDGWVLRGQASGGLGTDGTTDQGTVNASIFTKISNGSESGTQTVSIPDGNCAIGYIAQWHNSTGSWDLAATTGVDATADTAVSITAAANPGVTAGDFIIVLAGFNADTYGMGSRSMSQTGVSAWVSHTERQEVGTYQGNDCDSTMTEHVVQTGTGSAAPVFTETAGGSATYAPTGPGVFLRLRESAGSISGVLSQTLGDLTLASTGTVALAGTLTKTLEPLTLQSTGTLGLAGVVSKTLDALTLVSTGELDLAGVLAKTLDDLMASGAGGLAVAGTLTKTLADLTASAAGTLALAGTLTQTLEPLTSQAAGTVALTGSLTSTLDDLTAAATGEIDLAGTLTSTLDDLTAASAGVLEIAGVVNKTLDDLMASGAGGLEVTGVLTRTLDDLTAVAAGTLEIAGIVAKTLDDLTLAGTGTLAITGAADVTLDDLTLVATGDLESNEIYGSLSKTLDAITLASTGTLEIAGQVGKMLEALTASAAGTLALAGAVDRTLGDLTLAGSGSLSITGAVDKTLDDLTLAATGFQGSAITGTLNVTLDDLTAVATGTISDAVVVLIGGGGRPSRVDPFLMLGDRQDFSNVFWDQHDFSFLKNSQAKLIAATRRKLGEIIPELEEKISDLFTELVLGLITVADWYNQMRALLAEYHVLAWKAQKADFTQKDVQDVSLVLGLQLRNLKAFSGFLSAQKDRSPYLGRALSYAVAVEGSVGIVEKTKDREIMEYPEELAAFMPEFEDEITNLYADLVLGIITLAEWQALMAAMLARRFVGAWQLGGAPFTPASQSNLSLRLAEQLAYLSSFVTVLAAAAAAGGSANYAPFVSRAVSYAAAVVDPFWESHTWGLPLPTYPGAGDSQCLQWCKCEWDIQWIDRDNLDADAVWRLSASEHCQTCIERARQWNPLKIRGGSLI